MEVSAVNKRVRLSLYLLLPLCLVVFFFCGIVYGGRMGALLVDGLLKQGSFVLDVTVVNRSDHSVWPSVLNRTLREERSGDGYHGDLGHLIWPLHWRYSPSEVPGGTSWGRVLHEVPPGETVTFSAALFGDWNDVVSLSPLRVEGYDDPWSPTVPTATALGTAYEEAVEEPDGVSEPARLSLRLEYDGTGFSEPLSAALSVAGALNATGGLAVGNEKVYIANLFEGFVSALSVGDFSAGGNSASLGAASATGLDTPMAVAVAPGGDVYVADFGTSKVIRYDAGLTRQGEWDTLGTMPSSIAVDPTTGDVYVATAPRSVTAVFNGDWLGQSIERLPAGGAAFTEFCSMETIKENLHMEQVETEEGQKDPLLSVYSIAFDSTGLLHALVDGRQGLLMRITEEGVQSGLYLSWYAHAVALAFDEADNLILSDPLGSWVLRYEAADLQWGAPGANNESGYQPFDDAGTLKVPQPVALDGGSGSGLESAADATGVAVARRLSAPIAAILPDGKLAISEVGAGKLVIVDPASPDVRLFEKVIAEPTSGDEPASGGSSSGCALGFAPAGLLLLVPLLLSRRGR